MKRIELPNGAKFQLKTFEELKAEAERNGLAYQDISQAREQYQELQTERPLTKEEKADYEKITALYFQALAEEEEDAYKSAMNSI